MVSVSSSKTITYGERELTIPLVRASNNALCVCQLLEEHFSTYPSELDGPLFVLLGSVNVTLSVMLRPSCSFLLVVFCWGGVVFFVSWGVLVGGTIYCHSYSCQPLLHITRMLSMATHNYIRIYVWSIYINIIGRKGK